MNEPECSICQQLIVGQTVGRLQCNHYFCLQCIKTWADSSTTCPCCRKSFTEIECLVPRDDIHTVSPRQSEAYKLVERLNCEQKKFVAPVEDEPELALEDDIDDSLADAYCTVCGADHEMDQLLLCDGCNAAAHTFCIGLDSVPSGDWYCQHCAPNAGNGADSSNSLSDYTDEILEQVDRSTRVRQVAGRTRRQPRQQQRTQGRLRRLQTQRQRAVQTQAQANVQQGAAFRDQASERDAVLTGLNPEQRRLLNGLLDGKLWAKEQMAGGARSQDARQMFQVTCDKCTHSSYVSDMVLQQACGHILDEDCAAESGCVAACVACAAAARRGGEEKVDDSPQEQHTALNRKLTKLILIELKRTSDEYWRRPNLSIGTASPDQQAKPMLLTLPAVEGVGSGSSGSAATQAQHQVKDIQCGEALHGSTAQSRKGKEVVQSRLGLGQTGQAVSNGQEATTSCYVRPSQGLKNLAASQRLNHAKSRKSDEFRRGSGAKAKDVDILDAQLLSSPRRQRLLSSQECNAQGKSSAKIANVQPSQMQGAGGQTAEMVRLPVTTSDAGNSKRRQVLAHKYEGDRKRARQALQQTNVPKQRAEHRPQANDLPFEAFPFRKPFAKASASIGRLNISKLENGTSSIFMSVLPSQVREAQFQGREPGSIQVQPPQHPHLSTTATKHLIASPTKLGQSNPARLQREFAAPRMAASSGLGIGPKAHVPNRQTANTSKPPLPPSLLHGQKKRGPPTQAQEALKQSRYDPYRPSKYDSPRYGSAFFAGWREREQLRLETPEARAQRLAIDRKERHAAAQRSMQPSDCVDRLQHMVERPALVRVRRLRGWQDMFKLLDKYDVQFQRQQDALARWQHRQLPCQPENGVWQQSGIGGSQQVTPGSTFGICSAQGATCNSRAGLHVQAAPSMPMKHLYGMDSVGHDGQAQLCTRAQALSAKQPACTTQRPDCSGAQGAVTALPGTFGESPKQPWHADSACPDKPTFEQGNRRGAHSPTKQPHAPAQKQHRSRHKQDRGWLDTLKRDIVEQLKPELARLLRSGAIDKGQYKQILRELTQCGYQLAKLVGRDVWLESGKEKLEGLLTDKCRQLVTDH